MSAKAYDIIRPAEVEKYLDHGRDFVPDEAIESLLRETTPPDRLTVRDIIQKARSITTLSPREAAQLLHVADPEVWDEMAHAAADIKRSVYDNRIVTFAPLYLSNLCVNNCTYCGFRRDNTAARRRTLSMDEVRAETEVLAGRIGHKRLIAVYGEHPSTSTDYIADTIRTIYAVKVPLKPGRCGSIRRVNVNAAPLPVEDLRRLHEVGIGTFQVFQETYHKATYAALHPAGTVKADYRWRLYCMHRAMEAGVDDVGIGALFGLYDWRFEVLALLHHAVELEARFGIGPHTVSFPRLEPASNSPLASSPGRRVSDDDFRKLVIVLRLAIPYTGMIITAREGPAVRRAMLPLGCTQTDASTRIGIGAYSDRSTEQEEDRQQFVLGDTRSLDDLVRELAQMGCITSFCTAGYRCGRTGKCIMDLLRSGQEGRFCKLNAVLTYREWLDDFASEQTRALGERVITKEIGEIRTAMPKLFGQFLKAYEQVSAGTRDVYF